mgnify:CR=1 FL=1
MKKRVIAAIVALIISVPLIYKGDLYFYLFAILLSLLGLREILSLITDNSQAKLISYISLLTIIGSGIMKTNFDNLIDYKIIGIILLLNCVLMLMNHKNKNFDIAKCFNIIGVTLFLGVAFETIIITRNMSLYYFIYIFLVALVTDTFAHLIGTLFGKHKINEISPNKSWEGCIGGLCFGSLVSVLFYLIFINQDISIFIIILITMFLSIIAQLGDLFFSQIKRYYKIKDFSNIMPGHGGILDRLDSVIFVSLAFTYFITFI